MTSEAVTSLGDWRRWSQPNTCQIRNDVHEAASCVTIGWCQLSFTSAGT